MTSTMSSFPFQSSSRSPASRPVESIKSASASEQPAGGRLPSSWFLKVAVGGKPNFLFMTDNLTPAPASQIQQAMREDLTLEDPSYIPPQTPQPTRRPLQLKSQQTQSNDLADHDDLVSGPRSPANIQHDDNNSMSLENEQSTPKKTQVQSMMQSQRSGNNSPTNYIPSPVSSPSRTNRYIRDSDIKLMAGNGIEAGYPSYHTAGYGQDAWFIAVDETKSLKNGGSDKTEPVLFVGVSDGVGGWRSSGVDSGIMARAIMKNSVECITRAIRDRAQGRIPSESDYNSANIETIVCQPREVLARAYNKVKAENQVEAGSTTACLLSFVPASLHNSSDSQTACSASGRSGSSASSEKEEALFMHSCNLGDSGFVMVRNGAVCGQSEFQRDETNVVKQLAVIPPSIQASSEYYEYCDDKPHDAVCACHAMKENDILVLASDGLWDNLQSEEPQSVPFAYGLLRMRMHGQPNAALRLKRMHERIESAVKEATNQQTGEIDCQMVLSRLVKYSQDYMRKPEGKPDDLTILVAQVKRNHHSNNSSTSGTTQSA